MKYYKQSHKGLMVVKKRSEDHGDFNLECYIRYIQQS